MSDISHTDRVRYAIGLQDNLATAVGRLLAFKNGMTLHPFSDIESH
jgi:hypothetical protein